MTSVVQSFFLFSLLSVSASQSCLNRGTLLKTPIFSFFQIISFLPCLLSIMVPTGKLTPITPARPTARSLPLQPYRPPAPVVEYSADSTEPPPLDPSYVPVTYKYLHYLIPKAIVYVSNLIHSKSHSVGFNVVFCVST
jgi:hypothetical protein